MNKAAGTLNVGNYIFIKIMIRDERNESAELGFGPNFPKSSVRCKLELFGIHCRMLCPNPLILKLLG